MADPEVLWTAAGLAIVVAVVMLFLLIWDWRGRRGRRGFTGFTGADGADGVDGVDGAPGAPGVAGARGFQGIQGPQSSGGGGGGAQGPQGITGVQGITGLQGPQGVTGAGVQGPQGAQGITGLQGTQGVTGAGVQGPQGAQGITGVQGGQGAQGSQGGQGSQGAQGIQGITGLQGAQGVIGFQGAQGAQGSQGAQGIQGVQGTTGPEGSALVAYAYVYNNATTDLFVPPCGAQSAPVPFNNGSVPVTFNITFDGVDTLTLPFNGFYEGTFEVVATTTVLDVPSFANFASFKLTRSTDGGVSFTDIPGSIYYNALTDSSNIVGVTFGRVAVSGQVKFAGATGDLIRLENNTLYGVTLSGVTAFAISTIARGSTAADSDSAAGPVSSFPVGPMTVSAGSSVYLAVQTTGFAPDDLFSAIDNQGNPYNGPFQIPIGGPVPTVTAKLFFVDDVAASAAYTVTISFPSSSNVSLAAELVEYSGTNPAGSADLTRLSTVQGIGGDFCFSFTSTNINEVAFASIAGGVITGTTFGATGGSSIIAQLTEIGGPGPTLSGAALDEPLVQGANAVCFTAVPTTLVRGIGVPIIPLQSGIPFCATPVNASLDVKLLRTL